MANIYWYTTSVVIPDCYLLTLKEITEIVLTIKLSRRTPIAVKVRDSKDLENEIIAHKILYLLHYKVDHTKDCDLDDEPKYRSTLFNIIGNIYRLFCKK